MAIEVKKVNAVEVRKITDTEENHFFDVKSIEITPGKLTRTISAFANSDGGEVFIGIKEENNKKDRKWYGFSNPEAANGHIQAFESISPLSGEISFTFLETSRKSDGLVLHATIQKTRDVIRASDGIPYTRMGAQNIPVKAPEALDILHRNKGITSFETHTVKTTVESVSNSETIIEFLLSVVPIAEPLPWLKKQSLVYESKPTVAGLVLFSDEPQAALPKRCAIKIYRYRTTEEEGTRETLAFNPITIEGCLYQQIKESVSKTINLIQEVKILGPSGLEPISYPFETLHEIITNAVLHRDYGIADDVHVRIFDNRVEVESPGRLPAHVTEKNILTERFSRNGSIVRLINKFPNPPNKDIGEGLNTAFAAMKKLQLRSPVIHQMENAVVVDIRHQKLGSPEEIVMEFLEDHEEVRNKQVRQLTGIGSENKVKSIFYSLHKSKQIERVPGKHGSASAWRKYTGDSEK